VLSDWIVIEIALVSRVEFASVTDAVKLKVPACVVVPEISPLFLSSASPFGKAPDVTAQV
jgi:hypothetical protein